MTSSTRKLLWVGAGAIFVVVLFLAAFAFLLETGTPKRNRYLIPEAFSGWLCLTYSVASAPVLPIEDGFRVAQFPAAGVLTTSDAQMPGKMKDEFYRYGPRGRQPLNAARELGGGFTESTVASPASVTFKFWVSRDAVADYARIGEGRPANCGAVESQ